MTSLLAAMRLDSAGRLDCPPHVGSSKSQFLEGMICPEIRDVQILISVVGGEPLSFERCRCFSYASPPSSPGPNIQGCHSSSSA